MFDKLETDAKSFLSVDMQQARSRFYPGWWTHSTVPRPDDQLPHYRVVCSSESERRLALAAKPDHVVAELVYPADGSDRRSGSGISR